MPPVPKPKKQTKVNKESVKQARYRITERAMAKLGYAERCVLCVARVPGGSGVATDHHEIIPKSELPGESNLAKLYGKSNVVLACREHHSALYTDRLLWMKAMVKIGIASSKDYVDSPYWDSEEYPPTQECFGKLGNGSMYFRKNPMSDSLAKEYFKQNPNFDAGWFCGFCPVRHACARKESRLNTFPL